MRNSDYLRDANTDELRYLEEKRKAKGLTYEDLAKKINVNKVWLASAFKGQQWVPDEYIEALAKEMDLEIEKFEVLREHPYKADTDPILYRLHEALNTYGPAIKEIIHEKSGNAIMSAIDFGVDVEIEKDPKGDRVIITMNGKLLPYSKGGKYPW
ncbi:MAG: cyanase [Clostridium sp.]